MYSTCLFCNGALGANEVIEHFPVGRRLAYDAANGRLWVVCRLCERWNLSPIESRWEAIEEAERAFRGTKVRVSSDNIAMARLRDETELVRIGKPPRTEFAVWRYGDQFEKRHRRALQIRGLSLSTGLATTALISGQLVWKDSLGATAVAAILGASTLLNLGSMAGSMLQTWRNQSTVRTTVRADDDTLIPLTNVTVREIAFLTGGRDFDWKLKVPRYAIKRTGVFARLLGVDARAQYSVDRVYLHGDAAVSALAKVLPHVNGDGASEKGVKAALEVVNDASNVQQLLQHAARLKSKRRVDDHMDDGQSPLGGLPAPMRLALEMALHEDDERRAMEGELQELERRWREADAIAKIADALLVAPEIDARLDAQKGRYTRSARKSGEGLGDT